MPKIYWSRQKIMAELGIKRSSVEFFENYPGCPKFVARKGYPAHEFCEFIVARPQKCKDKTDIRARAEAFLLANPRKKKGRPKKIEDAFDALPDDKPPDKPVKPAAKKVSSKEMIGMQSALNRAREVELVAYSKYKETLDKTGTISTASLESWQKTLDILRRCETDFGKVLERQEVLIEKRIVQDWLEQMIEQTKTILLNLPAKMAPSLEGLAWHDIQQRLDQEIRDVVAKIQNFS